MKSKARHHIYLHSVLSRFLEQHPTREDAVVGAAVSRDAVLVLGHGFGEVEQPVQA
jgi:hypothetical protein